MAYVRKIYDLGSSREYEYNFRGKYGAKGEKRSPRRKRTPEEVEKQNHRNKVKTLRRKITLNFEEGDLWVCLKYPAGVRKHIKDVKQDVREFCTSMRAEYKRRGIPFKWVRRIEVGHLGGIHVHFIINRIPGEETGLIVNSCWKPGTANIQYLHDADGYEQLAEYIAKEPESDDGQTVLPGVGMEEKKAFMMYSCSRNLKRPKDVMQEKEYTHTTMRKIISEGPRPAPGYYIDPDSIREGINPFTGMSFLYYTEYRLKTQETMNFNRYVVIRENIKARKHRILKRQKPQER